LFYFFSFFPNVTLPYNEICITSCESVICPICGGGLQAIGSRGRTVINFEGQKKIYRIRRLRCKEGCGKIHHELPDSIVPYKRHSALTIAKIGEAETGGLCAETSTISKLRQFVYNLKEYYLSVLPGLKEKYKDAAFPACPKLSQIVRTLTNGNLWPYTRSAFCPGRNENTIILKS
jgi:hypothetical protein